MNIEAIIKAPTKDPEWIKKCLLIGLFALIPIAGALNMMGWMKETYRRAKAGDSTLPPAALEYIGSGWALFVAVLPIIVVPIFFGIVQGGLIAARMHKLVPLVQLVNLPVSLFINLVFVPTLVYRHVVHGTGFGGAFDFGGIKRTWTANTGNFAMYALVYFLASLIGGLGSIACCIGLFVTLPFGLAIHAHVIKNFEDVSGGV